MTQDVTEVRDVSASVMALQNVMREMPQVALETQHYFAVDFATSADHQDITRPLRVPESAER